MTDAQGSHQMTFIVRLSREGTGAIVGVVERVRTGEKERFQGLDALAPLITRMTRDWDH